jgi:hypothetical protein
MNNQKITKCYLIATAIAILAVFTAAPVGARELNWKLKGDYAWNSTSTCASATLGFDPTTLGRLPLPIPPENPPSPVPGISYNYAVQGVLSFDGHGVLNFKKGEVLSIMLEPYPNPATNPPLPTSSNFRFPVRQFEEMECTGTYVVDDEGVVGITFTSCGVAPQTFDGATLQGRLDTVTGTSIVFLSNTLPTIEVVGGTGSSVQRICNATGSMVKLSPRKNWFSKE